MIWSRDRDPVEEVMMSQVPTSHKEFVNILSSVFEIALGL